MAWRRPTPSVGEAGLRRPVDLLRRENTNGFDRRSRRRVLGEAGSLYKSSAPVSRRVATRGRLGGLIPFLRARSAHFGGRVRQDSRRRWRAKYPLDATSSRSPSAARSDCEARRRRSACLRRRSVSLIQADNRSNVSLICCAFSFVPPLSG